MLNLMFAIVLTTQPIAYHRTPADTCHCPRATVKVAPGSAKTIRHGQRAKKSVKARPRASQGPFRTVYKTVHDTLVIEKQPIYKEVDRIIYKEPPHVVTASNCPSVRVGAFGQAQGDDYPNMAGGMLQLRNGRWSTRLSLAGNKITELGLDMLYHPGEYLYVGGGVLAEWSSIEETSYLVSTYNSETGEKDDKKEHSKRKKGKKEHSKRHNDKDSYSTEDIIVTTTVLARTTSRSFDLSPSATVGLASQTNPSLYGEGRVIFADRTRMQGRVGIGYGF